MRLASLIALGTLVAATHASGAATPARGEGADTAIVAPLADPAIEPGIGRCTSDGVCTVTDARGTRESTTLRLAR